jgi:hypothetical protein
MFTGDNETLAVEMCKKWPGKFTDQDLKHWCSELHRFRIDDVLHVLTSYKAECKYVPKLPEIRGRLAKRSGSVVTQAQRYVTVLARDVAGANPHLQGKPEAELILRYHRRWWCQYRADSERRAAVQAAKGKATEQVYRDRRLESIRGECVRDLCSAGIAASVAEQIASCVDWPQYQFDEAIADLENVAEHMAPPAPEDRP